jgi:hypothetical protein
VKREGNNPFAAFWAQFRKVSRIERLGSRGDNVLLLAARTPAKVEAGSCPMFQF